MQTVHADAAGHAATRPAQTSGRLQVTERDWRFLGTFVRDSGSVSSVCFTCRQKRSMGLTLAEDELSRLDSEPGKELSDRECSCAEHVLSKIEDLL